MIFSHETFEALADIRNDAYFRWVNLDNAGSVYVQFHTWLPSGLRERLDDSVDALTKDWPIS